MGKDNKIWIKVVALLVVEIVLFTQQPFNPIKITANLRHCTVNHQVLRVLPFIQDVTRKAEGTISDYEVAKLFVRYTILSIAGGLLRWRRTGHVFTDQFGSVNYIKFVED